MPNKTKNRSKAQPVKPTLKKNLSKKTVLKKVANKPQSKLPNVFKIAKASWLIIWRNRMTLAFIILIYGLAYVILILALTSPGNFRNIKQDFDSVFHGHLSHFGAGLSALGYLISSANKGSNPGSSAYQIVVLILASLSIIWALRQFYLGVRIRARDSYYQGLYPLAPYFLVLVFIVIELIPLVGGLALYGALINGGIAITLIEKSLSIILVILLAGLSLYLICPSIMALYIAALPNMTPLKALKSASDLVKGRRWQVLRKILFLPLLLCLVIAVIMLPFIFLVPVISAWIFFLLVLLALVYVHSYLYSLYRELINE